MQPTIGDTIVAIATGSGEAAIAMIRLSGPEAWNIVARHMPNEGLQKAKARSLRYGLFEDSRGEAIDEVVITLYKKPASYTGEDIIEITSHGSPLIAQKILEACIQSGARLAERGEFTMRAFLNGKMDLSQAESVADLISAQSDKGHQLALRQLRGSVSDQIKKLREELINFASLLELELDFAEEDVEFADRAKLKSLVIEIRDVVSRLMHSFKVGSAMKNGVMTVIAGRPNAGKSTLLNALLDDDRAIVSEIAGTTRDTIEETLQIDGILFRLVDTAGLREAEDTIEAIGVERAMQKVEQSAIMIYLFDVTQLSPEEVNTDISRLVRASGHNALLAVANKMDLNPYLKSEEWAGTSLEADQIIPMSAKNLMNVEYLKERLSQSILDADIDPNLPMITNARHYQALLRVDEGLQAVQDGFENQVTSDFIAMDLRQALHWLGEITGEVTTDDLLGNIFSNFCIGK